MPDDDNDKPDRQALGLLICMASAVVMALLIMYALWKNVA